MLSTAGLPETVTLCGAALSIGAIHTLLGPDHYVPFAAMSRAGNWSLPKTLGITLACGLGHVAGSVIIGLAGLALGVAVMELEGLEGFRGDLAAWLLIGFGLAYLVWGLVQASRNVPHAHVHLHADGTVHTHEHTHDVGHLHVHGRTATVTSKASSTPWILFLLFAFGPCEPLIPLLMYPAAKASPWAVAAVVVAFTVATVATMMLAVMALRSGVALVPARHVQRYAHALAGLAVLTCGILVMVGL
ncbi:MAG: sulfite exporter TauE/SafE family protein [Planctomycetia bacterium]|nr:sulfite exporter TauE/SafE family protein [Planctomycetia bacterium]